MAKPGVVLKVARWGTAILSVVSAGMVIYTYACGTANGMDKFQAWSSFCLCAVVYLNISLQLRKKRRQ